MIVPNTKPASRYDTSAYSWRMPIANSTANVTTPAVTGQVNCRLRFDVEARRQAISGPMPVSASSSNPSGPLTALKNGGPTVILSPFTHSLRIGKSTPQSVAKQMPTSTRLLYRNAASRLTMLSSSAFACRSFRRVDTRYAVPTATTMRKPRNQSPTGDCAKACTLSMMPLRVMKVPRIVSRNDIATSVTFHLRSMPRFSWIMMLCRNAVVVSHGKNDEFSTASHAQ